MDDQIKAKGPGIAARIGGIGVGLGALLAIFGRGGERAATVVEHAAPSGRFAVIEHLLTDADRTNPGALEKSLTPKLPATDAHMPPEWHLSPPRDVPRLPDVSPAENIRTPSNANALYDLRRLLPGSRVASLLSESAKLTSRLRALSARGIPVYRYQQLKDRLQKNDDQIHLLNQRVVADPNSVDVQEGLDSAQREQLEIKKQAEKLEAEYG